MLVQVQFLALYFLETSLLEVDCLSFEPAQLSFAALSLAHRLMCEARIKDTDALQEHVPKFHVYRYEQAWCVPQGTDVMTMKNSGSANNLGSLPYFPAF